MTRSSPRPEGLGEGCYELVWIDPGWVAAIIATGRAYRATPLRGFFTVMPRLRVYWSRHGTMDWLGNIYRGWTFDYPDDYRWSSEDPVTKADCFRVGHTSQSQVIRRPYPPFTRYSRSRSGSMYGSDQRWPIARQRPYR